MKIHITIEVPEDELTKILVEENMTREYFKANAIMQLETEAKAGICEITPGATCTVTIEK